MAKRLVVFLLCAASLLQPVALPAQKQGQARIDSLLAEVAQMKEDTAAARLLDELSGVYNSVNPTEGLRWAEEELVLASKLGWRPGLAGAYNNIGNNYQAQDKNPQALEAFFRSLKIWEELNNKEGIGVVSGNIGILYKMQKNFPEALKYELKALKLADEHKDSLRVQLTLGNIGNVYEAEGRYGEALAYEDRSLRLAEQIGYARGVSLQTGNIAAIYMQLKQYARALAYSFRSLRLSRDAGDRQSIAANLGNIGEIYTELARGRTIPAPDSLVPSGRTASLALGIAYLRQGVDSSRASSFTEAIPELSQYLSEALALAGDYRGALAAYRQYTAVRDSLYNIENNSKITNLETQRAVELKNKQLLIDRLEVSKKRNQQVFYIIGIGLLLAVVAVVFRNYRVQKVLNAELSVEKEKVELHTQELSAANTELNAAFTRLQETQAQLILAEKQKENEIIRSRISQDIHDDISSELTRISWVSELATTKMSRDEYGEMPYLLRKITSSSRETIAKLGEIIWTVDPQNDTLASLLAYMRSQVAKFLADTPLAYDVDFPDEDTDVYINPVLKRNLYMVVKEALNNALKYSGAQRIRISMHLDGAVYCLVISDDGQGLEAGVVLGGGNGLSNMRRRMEEVQGTFRITSAPGNGAMICCEGILS